MFERIVYPKGKPLFPLTVTLEDIEFVLFSDGTLSGDIIELESALRRLERDKTNGLDGIIAWLLLRELKGKS